LVAPVVFRTNRPAKETTEMLMFSQVARSRLTVQLISILRQPEPHREKPASIQLLHGGAREERFLAIPGANEGRSGRRREHLGFRGVGSAKRGHGGEDGTQLRNRIERATAP
jgi:hypothetical protein